VAAPVAAPSMIADAEPATAEADTAASEAVEETESTEPTKTTATSGPDETSTRA
jgi:hypothetical protein